MSAGKEVNRIAPAGMTCVSGPDLPERVRRRPVFSKLGTGDLARLSARLHLVGVHAHRSCEEAGVDPSTVGPGSPSTCV